MNFPPKNEYFELGKNHWFVPNADSIMKSVVTTLCPCSRGNEDQESQEKA